MDKVKRFCCLFIKQVGKNTLMRLHFTWVKLSLDSIEEKGDLHTLPYLPATPGAENSFLGVVYDLVSVR